ncbi:MAG: ACP S-malonyltransferase [Leptospiraceae bacterium]|nr:ACP S-malonyltransferase [Leptospiraceae bacterium]MCK6382474.1 ACP S-malonyltransferase [Leptospiraceae bacterium]NUM42421.1 ACP S-malonyltransferase [Leptospiraceae bacterium]
MTKVLNDAKQSGKKLFLQFGGQGSPYLKEISKLYEEPLLKEFFEVAFSAIQKEEKRLGRTNLISEGLNIQSWIENPDKAPSENYLCRGSVSVGMIFITQLAHYHLLTLKGYSVSELMANSSGTTGHSQGIVAASLAALGKEKEEFYDTFSKFITFIFYLGYRAQEQFPFFDLENSVLEGNSAIGDKNPAPMVACIGYSKDELEKRVNEANDALGFKGKDTLYISLYNTPDSMIISGKPSSLLGFRKKFHSEMEEKKAKFVYLKTTAPFHCPLMDDSWVVFQKDLESYVQFPFKGSDLKIPVYSIWDGRNFQSVENLAEVLFKEVVIQALHWDKAVGQVLSNEKISPVIDFGPSVVSAKLTQGQIAARGKSNQVLCAANPKDLKILLEG